MDARELYDFLRELHNNSTACGWNWPELHKINVNIRTEWGDVQPALLVSEDLFDVDTNNILTDIIISAEKED
jgi:hypothetical protein